MRDIAVIIVAAGESKRLKSKVRKPYLILNGKPILRHSIDVFKGISAVREIVIAINPKDIKKADKIIRGVKNIKTVIGGARRSDSVLNALKSTSGKSKIVLVHDAARPFVSRADVIRLIKEVRRTGAAILAIPVADTIKMTEERKNHKRKNLIIKNTVTPRESLWAAQTPQGFRRDLLIKAYQNTRLTDGQAGIKVTDDSSLVEGLGISVSIVQGSEDNIKITTKADIN